MYVNYAALNAVFNHFKFVYSWGPQSKPKPKAVCYGESGGRSCFVDLAEWYRPSQSPCRTRQQRLRTRCAEVRQLKHRLFSFRGPHGALTSCVPWGERRQWSYLPISGAVWLFTIHLPNASAKIISKPLLVFLGK